MPPLLVSLGVLGRRHNSPPKNTKTTKTGCTVLSIVLLRRHSSIFKTSTTVFVQWNISLSLRLIFVSQTGWINDSLPSYTESVHVFSCYYGYSDGTGLNVFIIPNQRGEEERRERLKAFWPCGWLNWETTDHNYKQHYPYGIGRGRREATEQQDTTIKPMISTHHSTEGDVFYLSKERRRKGGENA